MTTPNVVFMIGNGFDLNLGLKTRFKDFLPTFVENTTDPLRLKLKKEMDGKDTTWADFEFYLGETISNWTDSAVDLVYFVKGFNDAFSKYLLEQCSAFFDARPHLMVLPWYKALELDESIKYENANLKFINFNFTATLDALIKAIGMNAETLNVHGIAHKDTDEMSLLIGVDNREQIANVGLRNKVLTKILIKGEMRDDYDAEYRFSTASEWIDRADLIVIFGMDIGATDRTFWRLVGPRLKNKVRLIIVDVSDGTNDELRKKYFRDKILTHSPDEKVRNPVERELSKHLLLPYVDVKLDTMLFKPLSLADELDTLHKNAQNA